uniref:Uncharacterized protein n=1 Tax=Manihot esculenta TaxID=3983 RepID=A0A2C9UXJ1_MANES
MTFFICQQHTVAEMAGCSYILALFSVIFQFSIAHLLSLALPFKAVN